MTTYRTASGQIVADHRADSAGLLRSVSAVAEEVADSWLRDRHADETARRGDVPAAAVHVVAGRVVEVREGSPEGRALATWEDGAEAIADLLRLPYLQPEAWEAAPLPGPAPLRSGYERLGRRPVDWAA